MNLRKFLTNVGWDGALWGLCGLTALSLGLLDYLPQFQLTEDPILRLVLSFVGLILSAFVTQNTQRRYEIQELKNALGMADLKLVDTQKEYMPNLVLNTIRSKSFVSDTFLNWATPRSHSVAYLTEFLQDYNKLIYERVSRREIVYRQVQIIYHKQGLEEAIHRLLLHEGYMYFIKHYDPGQVSIPMLHLVSFDDEMFYLGIGYPKSSPPDNRVLYVNEPNLNNLLRNYWLVLWNDAIPLNEGSYINWDELKRIGCRTGLSENEFEQMVKKIKEDVVRDKKRLKTGRI